MKKIFLSGSILLMMMSAMAQSKLSIKAADSLAFVLTVNNTKITNLAIVDITLSDLQSGKTTVQISVPRNPLINITQELLLKPNGSYYYEVLRSKGKYKLQLVSESVSALTEDESENENTLASTIPLDTLVIEVPIANEETGDCDQPASVVEFEALKTELIDLRFEMRKLERMTAFAEQNCIRVEQLRYMMAQLSTEDSKLKLLKTASVHVFDKSRLSLVQDDFFLEKNKVKAKEIITMN